MFLTKRQLDSLLNKAFMNGFEAGRNLGRVEYVNKNMTPNDIRESFGLKPIEHRKENEQC